MAASPAAAKPSSANHQGEPSLVASDAAPKLSIAQILPFLALRRSPISYTWHGHEDLKGVFEVSVALPRGRCDIFGRGKSIWQGPVMHDRELVVARGFRAMAYISSHFGVHVSDLAAARRFYVDQLGLPILQDTPSMKLLAVRAGGVRLSIFGDRVGDGGQGPSQIILATDDLTLTVAELKERGISPIKPPAEAPGFMKFINVLDPDGNAVGIVEYLRDPLAPI